MLVTAKIHTCARAYFHVDTDWRLEFCKFKQKFTHSFLLCHVHNMKGFGFLWGRRNILATSISKNLDNPSWQTKSWCAKLKTFPWKFDLLMHLLSLGADSSFTSLCGGLAWSRLRWTWLNLLTATCGSQSTCNPGYSGSHVFWKWVIGPSSCSGPQLCYCANGLYIDIPFFMAHTIFKIPNSTRSL